MQTYFLFPGRRSQPDRRNWSRRNVGRLLRSSILCASITEDESCSLKVPENSSGRYVRQIRFGVHIVLRVQVAAGGSEDPSRAAAVSRDLKPSGDICFVLQGWQLCGVFFFLGVFSFLWVTWPRLNWNACTTCSPPIDCDVFVSRCASPPSLSRRRRSIRFLLRQVTSRFSPSHSVEDSLKKKQTTTCQHRSAGAKCLRLFLIPVQSDRMGFQICRLPQFFLKVWAGASTKWLGGINATREWERQKKVVVFFFFFFGGGALQGQCVCCICLNAFSVFALKSCCELTHCS